jgi:hypothetical protein
VVGCAAIWLFVMAATPAAAGALSNPLFTDPQDGKMDASMWLLSRSGFLAVPLLITEPAVGYGGGAGIIFLHYPQGRPAVPSWMGAPATSSGKPPVRFAPPSITGAMGFATENGTWAAGLFHQGIWSEDRWRYTGAVLGGDIHLKFYGEAGVADVPEGLEYGLRGGFLYQEIERRLGRSDFFAGLRFTYSSTESRFEGADDVPGIPADDFNAKNAGVGFVLGYDSRDNTFTPNRGWRLKIAGLRYDEAFGGDYSYYRMDWFSAGWWTFHPRLVGGWKVGLHFTDDDGHPPYFDLPAITLRGVRVGRYQGKQEADTEIELRWALDRRWSLVAFGGAGRVAETISELGNADDVFAGGVGFRYLIARLLGIHAGVDFAWGPDDFAWYLTLGNAWRR